MSQNFWKFVKLGTRPDVKVMSAKSGQDPLRFEKDTIKSKFYTEFKERWQASADPVESPPRTYTDHGRFGQELDREVTMSDRVGSHRRTRGGYDEVLYSVFAEVRYSGLRK